MNDQLCDDGSNLISAVQSAVTHFFGQHEPRVNEEMPEQDGSSTQSQSSPTKQSQQQQQCSSTSETASITILPSSSSNSSSTYLGDSSNNNNILLTSRARSMSPSLSLHSISNTESLSYYPDMYYYYNNPLLINCNSPTNYYYGTYEQDPQDDGAWSYFETSDFSSQTWLNVLQETDTIHYCGAGAAILTAVIIIHPLALIGAAATAAVGASAAWAVGLFHDLDKGYQIWNHDDFGMLFWEEEGANVATGATNVVVDPCNFVSNTAAVGGCSSATTTTAAIATWGSQQIIQRNEEELRRAFLLEQEEKQQREKKEALLLLEQQQGQGVVEEEAKLGDNDETDDRDIVTLPQQQQQSNVETKLQSISLQETNRLIRINSAPVKELSSSSSIRVKSSRKQNQQQQVLLPPRQQQPNKATQHPTNPLHPPTILSTQQSLDRHYPPLEIRVVSEVEFMDLNTIEFFQVFFSDDAPYSMKDFQQKRGDVDIVYGSWKDVIDVQKLSSFKQQQQQQPGLVFPFPPNSYTRERVLTFHTMTKSYFGPAYAKATKIQRATQLSKHLLVIENMSQLSEVPFSDRFQVLERWIVEAVKSSSSNDGSSSSSGGGGSGGGLYTCKLTVYAEVVMISSCRFEPQIRKKASETFTELTLGWCKLATKALEATKEQKRKRMRKHEQQQEQLDDRNDYSVVLVGDDEASWQDEEERSKKSRVGEVLLAKHQQKFQELDDLVSHGDGIEVMHSIKAGAHSAFAQVLETPPSSLSHSSSSGLLKLRDGTVVEVARRRTTNANNNSSTITPFGRIPRKMNRSFLLRKLSSRVRSRQQSR